MAGGKARGVKPHIVMLPGLDGTGRLLEEFSGHLEMDFRVTILDYPGDAVLGYEALLAQIRGRLPEDTFILLGESFSGPLALLLAGERPLQIRQVILAASFARLDLPLKRVLERLVLPIPHAAIPLPLIAGLLLGKDAPASLRLRLRTALDQVAPRVLAHRLREALRVDLLATQLTVTQPLLFLRASADRLMPRATADGVARIASDFTLREIAAPHFLLQSAPQACAREIRAVCVTEGACASGAFPSGHRVQS